MGFFTDVPEADVKAFKNREINRVLSLPIKAELTDEFHDRFSKATLLPSAEFSSLLKTQSAAIIAYLMLGGLFGYIGVGKGKALISFACASAAYRKGLRKILLLVPPKLVTQTVDKVLPELRRQISINFPVHVIAGKSKAQRQKICQYDSGVFIMAWSQLSITDTDELLTKIAPQLIIADEAHNLSNKSSSRFKRVNRYMVQNQETEFVALSGTMGKKSLKDYYHLMKWALKDNCPMPESLRELENWCTVLDTTFNEYTSDMTLEPMRLWAQRNSKESIDRNISGFRKSYNYRLATTQGVVFAVGNDDLGTSIMFSNEPATVPEDYPGMQELLKLRKDLHDLDKSPSGDSIDYAIHKFRYDYELSAGMYNSLIWPSVERICQKRSISESEAEDLLEKSIDYHKCLQEYHKAVRKWLDENACEGLDTPMLLGHSMYQHQSKFVGEGLFKAWTLKNSFDFEGRLERDSKAVRVCDYKIKAALKWAKELKRKPNEGALIWWQRQEVGKWAYEVFKEAGVDVVLADASQQGNQIINNDKNYNKIILASVTAYREGLNLQKQIPFMYFLQFPREAHFVEQATGRNHRTGCPYDELVYTTNFTLDFDHQMFSAVLADALFQHQAGSPSRLIYGDYDPIPKIAPGAVLREKGIVTGNAYDQIENELRRKFG